MKKRTYEASNAAKRQICTVLKELMTQKPLNRITVAEIMRGCGMARQHFYYHFDDVYDAVRWIFEEEAVALLDIALLRSQASEKGIAEIKQQDGRLLLTFAETDFARLSALCGDSAFKGRLLLNAGSSPYLSLRLERNERAMDMARLLVDKYSA